MNSESKWFDVKESPAPDAMPLLVFAANVVTIANFHEPRACWVDYAGYQLHGVTHWQFLPSPPKRIPVLVTALGEVERYLDDKGTA